MSLYELVVAVKTGFQIPKWILDAQNGVNMVKNVLVPNETYTEPVRGINYIHHAARLI